MANRDQSLIKVEQTIRHYIDADGTRVVREIRREERRESEDDDGIDKLITIGEGHLMHFSCGCPQSQPPGLQCGAPGCARQTCADERHKAYCVECRMPLCRVHDYDGIGYCPRHARHGWLPWNILIRHQRKGARRRAQANALAKPQS